MNRTDRNLLFGVIYMILYTFISNFLESFDKLVYRIMISLYIPHLLLFFSVFFITTVILDILHISDKLEKIGKVKGTQLSLWWYFYMKQFKS